MPNHYESELLELSSTYVAGRSADTGELARAIAAASESSIIAVGSGGSFTVASLLCNLHEAYTGRVSRPSTPLELISNPTLASSSPVFLISAEGKNPDIIEALRRARRLSARAIHVITNRRDSPLIQEAKTLGSVTTHIFALDKKDGYLATNSLLLDCIVVAKTYAQLDGQVEALPSRLEELTVNDGPIQTWLSGIGHFVREAASRGSIIVIFSPQMRAVAIDLESKLSEAALLHCQLTDIRSFAHGRHLWLAKRPNECALFALVEPTLAPLWQEMLASLPSGVPSAELSLKSASPNDQIAGLVAEMHLIGLLSKFKDIDPGMPDVPEFGRTIHYLDLPRFIPANRLEGEKGETAKFQVLGAQWPTVTRRGYMRRALEQFVADLGDQTFRSIVFDYDGTLCSSQANDAPTSQPINEHLRRLVKAGVLVGIASGRGGSIQEHIATNLPDIAESLHLGLYNGGWIAPATRPPIKSDDVSEFISHVVRIAGKLKSLGVPIVEVRPTQPYQVSIRLSEGSKPEEIWLVIADSLRQAGLSFSTVVKSKHSVDVLAPGVGKSKLVAYMIDTFEIDPYEILTMGDQGAWPGNDSALLEHRYSLSVDEPSRRLDRGWKLAPPQKRDVDATVWYLDRVQLLGAGRFCFNLSAEA